MGRARTITVTLTAVLLAACSNATPTTTAASSAATTSTPAATTSSVVTSTTALADPEPDFAVFESELETLRRQLRIPGMAAGVVAEGQLMWSGGFGEADPANGAPVTAATPFHLASVTKPIGATLVMQLVEEGLIGLDDLVSTFGVELPDDGGVTIRHLLTHTSEGVRGAVHNYDGNRYHELGRVVEVATGMPYREALRERILEPVGMVDAASGGTACAAGGEPIRDVVEEAVRERMAAPYQLDPEYAPVPSGYPTTVGPAAGLVASIDDLARFDIALDAGELVLPAARAEMFVPAIPTEPGRDDLHYGLGWYVQDYDGHQLLWHSGRWPPAVSALYLKVPEHDLSFFVLANTPNLTTPFPLGSGDVMTSALAQAFYAEFVYPQRHGVTVPAIDWEAAADGIQTDLDAVMDPTLLEFLRHQLWSRRMVFASVGNDRQVNALEQAHDARFESRSGLSSYLGSAADVAPPRLVPAVPADLAAFVGRMVFDPDASSFPAEAGEAPSEINLTLVGDEIVACARGEDAALVLRPTGPTSFAAVSGGAWTSFEFSMADGRPVGVTARLAPEVWLTYAP